jgi:small subunit ribosomal protein S16
MQRVGRKGHPEYRVVVQDARLTPTSGRIVARVGHYNPHSKVTTLDKEKVEYYLGNGAQPSPRVVRILQTEKLKLPDWVTLPSNDKKRSIKNADKLRRNRPAEEPKAQIEESGSEAEEPVIEAPTDESAAEEVVPADNPTEEVAEETTTDVATSEATDEEPAPEAETENPAEA